MNKDQDIDLTKAFTTDPFESFDALPVAYQEVYVELLKKECKLYQKRLKQNSKKMGGAPVKWDDDILQKILEKIIEITTSDAYKNRKYKHQDNKFPSIRAYEIFLESVYPPNSIQQITQKLRLIHKQHAKGIKEAVERYIKKTNTKLPG